jgi:hypothetical protein
LEATLAPEQMALYGKRVAERTARQKRVGILMIVARLDACLYLTGEQRDKIGESLSAAWQESWGQSVGGLGIQEFSLAALPEKCVVPHLNAEQAAAWRGMQKNTSVESVMMIQEEEEIEADDWWGHEPAKPAEKAAATPAS